jgi:sec-independent protein translocase protein TatB
MVTPPPIQVANIGMADTFILMVLALVVFGPRRLPQIGRQIGKLMYEFRKASNDFKFQMEEELRLSEDAERRKKEEAQRQQAALAAPTQTIEAQADIGAVEPAGTPAESVYPQEHPAEDAPVESEEVIHLPRVAAPIIQRPSTGEPIPAARPTARPATDTWAPEDAPAEISPSAEPPSDPAHSSSEEPHQTEPANQHG